MKIKTNHYLKVVRKSTAMAINHAQEVAISMAQASVRQLTLNENWTAKRIGHTPRVHLFKVTRKRIISLERANHCTPK